VQAGFMQNVFLFENEDEEDERESLMLEASRR
jgi:hypothetical protein